MLDLNLCSVDEILATRKSLRRQLSAGEGLRDLRIAVLGGSNTHEIVNLADLLMLSSGFRPVFHQSNYGRFYEEAVHDRQALIDFRPDIVYVHTSFLNVEHVPPLTSTEDEIARCLEAEVTRYREIWDSLEDLHCQVIQNNFEMPPYAILGNMAATVSASQSRFLMQLNLAFAREAARRPKLILQDVHGISTRIGLRHWFDWTRYFAYKLLLTAEGNLALARSLNSLVKAIYGRSRKVLVLDLDNTLWGGVIGDDGVEKIQIGRETAVAEAYSAFQEYCLSLRNRGILLAVCSKNSEDVAKAGFEHPSSILRLEHISCFKANWMPKDESILAIAEELKLGVDSFVFIDDNPAEREIVMAQLPEVAVPDVGSDVTRFAEIIDQGRYFEPAALSKEDLDRAELYASNLRRTALATRFANYGEYLDSLEMVAEIDFFKPVYLERIAQLTSKTNQFNLTTRRYTLAEMESISRNVEYVALYGKLFDRFGDNGLISVVVGRREGEMLNVDLWLMSCRVLKRDMELAMLDAVAERSIERGIKTIRGYYVPTSKNGIVAEFYSELGFLPATWGDTNTLQGGTAWTLDLACYTKRNKHIKAKVMERQNG
jgi:FkbH-like protein